jgi:hypothetical protein
MIYLLAYILIGLIMVMINCPVRKIIDDEIGEMKMQNTLEPNSISFKKMTAFRLIISLVFCLIYPLVLIYHLKEKMLRKKDVQKSFAPFHESEIAWLRNKITIQDAEAKNMVKIGDQFIPFGNINFQWKSILDRLQEGDELYEFESPSESWKNLAGRKGIALVRDGEIVIDLVTEMS